MITPFLTVREEWNKYKLSDGTQFKFKIPLSSVTIVSMQEKKANASFAQLFVKDPCPDDKGSPSPNPIVTDADIIEKLKFEREFESLNIYDIPEIRQILLCGPYLESVEKTGKFDTTGNRIYRYNLKANISNVPYPTKKTDEPPKSQQRLGE